MKRRNLFETSGFISDYLTHWTGRNKLNNESDSDNLSFGILEQILSQQRLKFGRNTIYSSDIGNEISLPMICFTDTPIEQSHAHRKKYGNFAVGYNKEKLIEYGAHPVLYYLKNFEEDVSRINKLVQYYKSNHRNDNKSTIIVNYFQPYSSENDILFPEYFEREWRISRLIHYDLLDKLPIYKEDLIEKKFNGKIIKENGDAYLEIDKSVIEFIIVRENFYKKAEELLKKLNLYCEIICLML